MTLLNKLDHSAVLTRAGGVIPYDDQMRQGTHVSIIKGPERHPGTPGRLQGGDLSNGREAEACQGNVEGIREECGLGKHKWANSPGEVIPRAKK